MFRGLWRWLEPGLRGVRLYWPALLGIQVCAVGFVAAYYGHAGFRAWCGGLIGWRESAGVWFAPVANVISAGVVPELLKWRLRPPGVPSPKLFDLLYLFVLFAILGLFVDIFYGLQAEWFGTGGDLGTLAAKIIVDQFGYTPFVALPTLVLWFGWKEAGFHPGRAIRLLFPVLFFRRIGEIFASNVAFWVPALVCVYSLPSALQFPLFLLLNSAWSILLVFIARRQVG